MKYYEEKITIKKCILYSVLANAYMLTNVKYSVELVLLKYYENKTRIDKCIMYIIFCSGQRLKKMKNCNNHEKLSDFANSENRKDC